ncbi:MAG TPA: dihydrodipicolinate reductase C-terminal domain-containing protein [Gemmatimonadaceae bacterium]|nr:dihydrodipicolinate reductase C-terminal domain-containing protein [Gemmatimonadaceae bacterium]
MTHRLAIVGMGKMGRAIAQLAPERGWDVVAQLDAAECAAGIDRGALKGAEVALEFSVPSAAVANARATIEAGCPIVVGTTGWYDGLPSLAALTVKRGGALLTSSNFSLGVNIFERVAAEAARHLAAVPGFDAHLIETHHATKKDAPSGTALALQASTAAAWGRQIPITSVRTGSIPGIHEFVFDSPFETIRLQHIARDRRAFAEGALVAAAWLIGKTGVFTMNDVLGGG